MKNVKSQSDMTPRQQTSVVSKLKVAGVSAAVTSLLCAALPSSYASDIEIYKVPEDSAGSTTLMMMLDTSGSMARRMKDDKAPQSGELSRLDTLKKGLIDVLQGTAVIPRVDDKIVMGLSDFSTDTGRILLPAKALGTVVSGQVQDGFYIKPRWQSYNKKVNGSKKLYYNTCANWDDNNYNCTAWSGETTKTPSGYSTSSPYQKDTNVSCNYGDYGDCLSIWEQPSKYRDKTHRDEMMTKINGLTSGGGTPTPYAYAEAAAYLMGQSTVLSNVFQNVPVYAKSKSSSDVWQCQAYNSNLTCSSWTNYTSSIPASYTRTNNCNARYSTPSTCYYYDKEFTNPDNTFSGLYKNQSQADSKNDNNYIMPQSIKDQINNPTKRECSGQGIYFLTDGQPEPGGNAPGSDGKSGSAYNLMAQTLNSKASLFSCLNSPLGKRSGYTDSQNAWTCTGRYAQALLDPAQNPTGLKIQTAVVGFSAGFNSNTDPDVQDAKDWGNVGGGGWVVGTNSQDVVDSINAFITQLNKDIPSMSTGSSTIPVDDLNPSVVQPYAYFPQFEPKVKPEDIQQIWFGNLKKYYVLNNGVYASKTIANDSTVVVKKSVLQDLADIWTGSTTYPDGTAVFKKGGALNQLMLGTTTTAGKTETGRKLFTDYVYDGTKASDNQVSQDLNLTQIKYTYTTDAKTKSDTKYARSLMGLLGYVISNDTDPEGLDLSKQTASLRQMGSVYHSKPLLLTQAGKAVAAKNAVSGKITINSEKREDYVLFGTTQGVVQVVDSTTGVEKFAFVPKEVIEHQSETFKQGGGNLAAGKDALYYGMDGEWVAHTVYVSKSDGTLTVKGTSRDTPDGEEKLSGKQWVYGGMRMGGRSYYSLDLTDINNPKVKFQIDPSTSTVYSQAHPGGVKYDALAKMGQSWSKPSLGYINWKGQRKLVMIVGGGYDAGGDDGDGLKANGIRTGYAGYEGYKYDQKNKIGAGVYMFDADTGDLLWNTDLSSNKDLTYSVASQIRTIDRNNDGLIDHLYFGDLAGQAFRVDFKNDGDKSAFTTQTTRILDLHATNGTSPRFYTLPAFTAHNSAGSAKVFGGNTVVVTFVSGSQSSPLLATTDSSQKKDSLDLQFDGAYGIFDYDAYPSTAAGRYPSSNLAARKLAGANATTPENTKLRYINEAKTATSIDKSSGWGGWYYQFNKKFDGAVANAAVIKGLTTPIALEGSLYVTQFDASNNGTTSSCGAGVKGHSFSQRLCLPGGVCKEEANYTYNLGSGIVTLNVGSADGDPNKRSLVVPDPNDVCTGPDCSPCKGAACGSTKFLETGGALRFIPNRWYEKYAQ